MMVVLSTGSAAAEVEPRVTPGHHWEEAGGVQAQEVMALARSTVVEEMPVEMEMASVRSLAEVGKVSPALGATETEEEGRVLPALGVTETEEEEGTA